MKPHRGIRKTVQAGGAVVCALILMVWVVSGWYSMMLFTVGEHAVFVRAGRVNFAEFRGIDLTFQGPAMYRSRGWPTNARSPFQMSWSFQRDSSWSTTEQFVPLWAPFLLTVGVITVARGFGIRERRREARGECRACGYNRTGLAPGAVCPECGTAALVPPPAAS